MKRCVFFLLVASVAAAQADLLNDYAIASGAGSLAEPLGTAPANATVGRTNLFDASASTYFETASYKATSWAGIQLTEPCVLTHVTYRGRSGWTQRMRGVLVQGANDAAFTNPQTLLQCMPDLNWSYTAPLTQLVLAPAATNAYTYFRIWSQPSTYNGCCAGNCTDLKFYGRKATSVPSAPAAAPVYRLFALNGSVTFRLANAESEASSVEIEKKAKGASAWTPCTATCSGSNEVTVAEGARTPGTFRVRYVNAGGAGAWTEDDSLDESVPHPLSGTWFGNYLDTSGKSYAGDSNGWDGNVSRHFLGPFAFDGTLSGLYCAGSSVWPWVALDLGASRVLSAVRLVPIREKVARARNCVVEVSNAADFSAVQVVAETPATDLPADAVTTYAFDEPVCARYVRVRPKSQTDVGFAEIEFDAPAGVPADLAVAMSDYTNQYAVLTWSADDASAALSVERAEAPGGPWTAAAALAAGATAWTDATALLGVTYWYRVRYAGSSLYTLTVSHTRAQRLERDWADLTQVKAGCTLIQKGGNANNGQYKLTNLCDGDVATFPDTGCALDKIGVDLGSDHALLFLRVHTRPDWAWQARGDHVVPMAAPASSSAWYDAGVPVAQELAFTGQYSWCQRASFDATAAFRYFWLTKPYPDPGSSSTGDHSFYGNVSEFELYGWPASAVADRLAPPQGVQAFVRDGAVTLVWKACANAVKYAVARRGQFSTGAWTACGETASPQYVDATGTADCVYRVTSVGADAVERHSDVVAPTAAVALGPWTGTAALGLADVGSVAADAAGTVTLTAGGGDLTASRETFRYLWQERSDAFDATFTFGFPNMTGQTAFTNEQKVAFMVRTGLGAGEAFVAPAVRLSLASKGLQAALLARETAGGATTEGTWTALGGGALTNGLLRVRRVGPSVRCWAKGPAAADWTLLGSARLPAASGRSVCAGAAVTAPYLRTTACTFTVSEAAFEHLPATLHVIVR